MTEVRLDEGDSVDRALKLFRRKLQKTGLFKELRRRRVLRQAERGPAAQVGGGATAQTQAQRGSRHLVRALHLPGPAAHFAGPRYRSSQSRVSLTS